MILSGSVLVPITSPPFEASALLVKNGKIKAIGKTEKILRDYPGEEIRNFKDAIILPGLVNLHTHLEYSSWERLAETRPFLTWLGDLVKRSKEFKSEDWENSYCMGIEKLKGSGVTTVVDIARSGTGLENLLASGLRGIYCLEFVAIDDSKTERAICELRNFLTDAFKRTEGSLVQIGLAPHSIYTLSRNTLLSVAKVAREKDLFLTIHLAESKAEFDFITEGKGPLQDFLREYQLKIVPAGGFKISPVAYLDECGILDTKVVVSHCVHVEEKDLKLLKKKSTGVALCVRSNYYLENGLPPVEQMKLLGLRFALGSDSLASNLSLDLFDELRFFRNQYQGFSAEELLKMITLNASEILGMEKENGSLEVGKSADLIIIRCKKNVAPSEVYQYLVDEGTGEDVILSMVNGKIVFEKGDYEGISDTPRARRTCSQH